MDTLKNIFDSLLSLILPKDARTIEIEGLTEDELVAQIDPANPLPNTDYKALFQYKNKITRYAIWEIKYRGNSTLAKKFSKLLYEFILEDTADEVAFSNFTNPLLIPIPASKGALRARGFNQSEIIVKEITKYDAKVNFEVSLHALTKIKETPHQSKLKNRALRLKNLSGCFFANSDIIRGRNIILIDDVITTSTTMSEVAKTLRAAGAKKVIGFAIAH